nr:carboxylesterase [Pharsalia antennata]
MSYITKSVTIIITLYTVSNVNPNPYSTYDDYLSQTVYTRNITLKNLGTLRGVVHGPKVNRNLSLVEVYRGIPYAAPPIKSLRFMPPGSAPSWQGIRYADTFGPVCPQKFPNENNMEHNRKQQFLRLKEYLQDQSEDCLYLNIYAPYQDPQESSRKYPVMVYIHGESFEWNSGNPYDGSVLAAYGKVIVVTLNFRLGILGFLKTGTEELFTSNFGLVDQIAALVWVKDHIEAFGGDANAITLFGHGTGAVCASLLTLSPMAVQQKDREESLFHRAILMGGTALADWALARHENAVTYQISRALNCQVKDDFAGCLRKKRLDEIMAASAQTEPYETRFGPIMDNSLIVPNDPKKLMTKYTNIFQRFELMYGVTELESIHLLGPVALTHGMLEKERDEELRKYFSSRCEKKPELCLMQTLEEYTGSEFASNYREDRDSEGREISKAFLARNALLDILSDARTVAPIVQMGKYHAALNLQSYFYVFTHKTHSRNYIRNKSFNGEELPYVFGVPLDGPKFHFVDSYTEHERLFSEVVMTYFCNFAYTGNPNMPRKNEYITSNVALWSQFDVEWPEYDLQEQSYLRLDIPPQPSTMYRDREMAYWNEIFPNLAENYSNISFSVFPTKNPVSEFRPPKLPPRKNPLPWINMPSKSTYIEESEKTKKPNDHPDGIFGTMKSSGDERPDNILKNVYTTVLSLPPAEVKQSTTINMVIVIGSLFLIANLILLFILYFKCIRNKKDNLSGEEKEKPVDAEKEEKESEAFLVNGCNIVRMMSKSSKSDDCEAVKVNKSTSNYHLTRQMSNSTIDAHTKVRDWITQEIVYKYSPRFFRKPGHNQVKSKIPLSTDVASSIEVGNDSTLGRSPTRPVSPTEDHIFQQPVIKTSTITRPKIGKPSKVSVAIDATPSGRGDSVLMQQPIELTKSLDYPHLHPSVEKPLRRSVTLEDFSPRKVDKQKDVRQSSTSINMKYPETEPTVIKIDHGYSRSEPVEDLNYTHVRKLKTFDPNGDVNVTSREDNENLPPPLTPEESLMTIKRRNFPKVLPDHPGREALMHKRRSMPAHGLFLPIPESSSFSQPNSPVNKSFTKLPPTPPPRTTTLSKQSSAPLAVCASEPTLIEPSPSPEPEIVCNNLYVGPLIPKVKSYSKSDGLNSQPIYDCLKSISKSNDDIKSTKPKTIVTANPNMPIKRAEPKIVVRPTPAKRHIDDKHNKHIPRVVVPDNQPQMRQNSKLDKTGKGEIKNTTDLELRIPETSDASIQRKINKKSQIPTPVIPPGSNKESISSESTTPSEESDTGTVVKKV